VASGVFDRKKNNFAQGSLISENKDYSSLVPKDKLEFFK